jgi:hypothetical protein
MNYILKKIEKKIFINNFFFLIIKKEKIFFYKNFFFFNLQFNKNSINILKKYIKENGFIK